MIMTLIHTLCYLFWLVILAASAVIAVSIASIVVKILFFDPKRSQSQENNTQDRR